MACVTPRRGRVPRALAGLAAYAALANACFDFGSVSSSGSADSGAMDATTSSSSGSSSGGSSGSTSGSSSGGSGSTSGGSSSGPDGSDDGEASTTCPVGIGGYTPGPYVPAVAHQGVCFAGDIEAFITACGDHYDATACDAWLAANVASSTDAGTSCGNCIFAPMNNGAVWSDPSGGFRPNYPGCVQILDPTNGAACATPYRNARACEAVACEPCSKYPSGSPHPGFAAPAGSDCPTTSDGSVCVAYVNAFNNGCAADRAADGGGAFIACSMGAAAGMWNPDYAFILSLICGS